MRNGIQIIGDTLYKVFSINLVLDFELVKELMTSGLSDHGSLKIKIIGVPDKAWFKRIKIPNKKIGQQIHDKVRNEGKNLVDLRKEFFQNPRRLIKKIRVRNSPWEEAKNKEILEDLANKVEIFEIKEKLKKGFVDFKTDTARKLYSKESKEGFANLRKL